MEKKNEYNISIKEGVMVLTTTSFRAEEGSFLHSGIYSRELASSLASGAVLVALAALLVYLKVVLDTTVGIVAVVLFFIFMVLFRTYVFFEEYLRVVVNKATNEITFFKKGFRSSIDTVPLDELRSIRWGITLLVPENPDGAEFVRKISAQHGMAVPGMGEHRELHSVIFELSDERDIMVFSSEEQDEADALLDMMNKFIGGKVA